MDKDLRSQEQRLALKHALSFTLKQMDTRMDDEEVFALFKDDFFKQVNSRGDYTIKLYTCDQERGVLDVEVIQHFPYIHGKDGEIKHRYQMVKEEYINKEVMK